MTTEEDDKLKKAGVFLHNEQRKGNWADSEVERLLRACLKYAKQSGASHYPSDVIEDGNRHMKLIEAMKKEFKLMRILWRQIYDHVAAVDELNMSTLRLRLRYEDEPVTSNRAIKRTTLKADDGEEGGVGGVGGNSQESAGEAGGSKNLANWKGDKFETIYILERHEVGPQRLKLDAEKTVALHDFKKKHGQVWPLTHFFMENH